MTRLNMTWWSASGEQVTSGLLRAHPAGARVQGAQLAGMAIADPDDRGPCQGAGIDEIERAGADRIARSGRNRGGCRVFRACPGMAA